MNYPESSHQKSAAYWRAMSHFGRFRVAGADGAALLHHLTTNDIKNLRAGEGCDAVLITNKARVLDWLQVWREGDEYLVLTSPNRRELFAPHARKFILYRQDVKIEDVTERGALFGLFGDIGEVLARRQAEAVLDAPPNARVSCAVEGMTLRLSRTRRLPGEGVLLAGDDREKLQNLVENCGVPFCDDATYNALRVAAGIPVAGLELTEDINPWEANLDFAISLHKGCYNGQEVVARLNTYQKIKQRLMRLQLEFAIPAGARIALKSNGRDAGVLTSSAPSPTGGAIGLGFVRTDFQIEGQTLEALSTPPQKATVLALAMR